VDKSTSPLLKNLFWSRFPIMMRAPLPSSGAADFPFAMAAFKVFLHSSSTTSNAGRIASFINVNANTLCAPLWSSIAQSFGVAVVYFVSREMLRIGHSYAASKSASALWPRPGSVLDCQTWRYVGKVGPMIPALGVEHSPGARNSITCHPGPLNIDGQVGSCRRPEADRRRCETTWASITDQAATMIGSRNCHPFPLW